MIVDNTPPVLRGLEGRGRHVTGEVVDGVGPIARIEVSVDGRDEWRPFLPKDGVFDEAVEPFDLDVSSLVPAGDHVVAVRAFDSAGNFSGGSQRRAQVRARDAFWARREM